MSEGDKTSNSQELSVKLAEAEGSTVTTETDKPKAPPSLHEQRQKILDAQKGWTLSLSQQLELNRLNKKIKSATRAKKNQQKMFSKYILEPQKKQHERLMNQVNILKDQIGRKDFQMLRDVFTVNIPEKKDEAGKVTQAASKRVDWFGLLQEGRNVIVVQREHRMASGLRKRTTGRHHERKAHNSLIRFLTERNAQELAKQPEQG